MNTSAFHGFMKPPVRPTRIKRLSGALFSFAKPIGAMVRQAHHGYFDRLTTGGSFLDLWLIGGLCTVFCLAKFIQAKVLQYV